MTRTTPIAAFMAFGTKGDVYPIAAIAAAFAVDQEQYDVVFITHSAHESLKVHLEAKRVAYVRVSSPPALAPQDDNNPTGSKDLSFSLQKREITRNHRRECVLIVERIFGDGLSLEGDLLVINFFALEGWSLAELFHIRCVVAAPYVVPYSAPSSFEGRIRKELPHLYKYLKEAPTDKVGWEDVIHWMWPLFTEEWASWRNVELRLSACPFMDPVTGLPAWHDRPSSPLILYGFSKEVVECPGYWPSKHGFYEKSPSISSSNWECNRHFKSPIYIVLCWIWPFRCCYYFVSSERVNWFRKKTVKYRWGVSFRWPAFLLLRYHTIQLAVSKMCCCNPSWRKVVCPFMLDQFYWAERMFWIGVAPEPLKRNHLLPDKVEVSCIREAAEVVARAINSALTVEVRARALDIAKIMSSEDGVSEAVRALKEEMGNSGSRQGCH